MSCQEVFAEIFTNEWFEGVQYTKDKIEQIKEPEMCNILKKAYKKLHGCISEKGYQVKTEIGKGNNGVVWEVCKRKDANENACDWVIKEINGGLTDALRE